MCSIKETIEHVELAMKHLHSVLSKLNTASDKDKINHNLYSLSGSVRDAAGALDSDATEEMVTPKKIAEKTKTRKIPAKKAKKVTKKKFKRRAQAA